VAIALALLAAIANAFATVLQRVGVEEAVEARSPGGGLMASVIRRPVWFAGLGLTTLSFLLEALALSRGDLSTVQPIMVTELVFLVAILGVAFRRTLGWREWVGASGTAAGLGAFLAMSESTGGTERPTFTDWVLLLIACVGAVGLVTFIARGGPRAWRAACFGVAAAICFALTAACIKTVADEWSTSPVWVFTHPEAYGIVIAGLAGFVISQHALEAGPVAASQSALLIVNPIASIVMGIWLFGDHLHHGGARTVGEALALGAMFLALFVLANSPLVVGGTRSERLSHPMGIRPEGAPS
jgi:drug/metabolite transporter (DMT)-like permease